MRKYLFLGLCWPIFAASAQQLDSLKVDSTQVEIPTDTIPQKDSVAAADPAVLEPLVPELIAAPDTAVTKDTVAPKLIASPDTVTAKDTAATDLVEEPTPEPVDFVPPSDHLTAAFHRGRREALRALMPDSSVAIFFANPLRNRLGDIHFEYHQDPNLYYLSGLQEPHAMLMVFKDPIELDSLTTNEILFVQPKNRVEEMWNGRRIGAEFAQQKLGVHTVFESNTFADQYYDFSELKVFYMGPEDDVRDDPNDRGDLYSLIKHFKFKLREHEHVVKGRALLDIMAALRQKKSEEELTLTRKAIEHTCAGLRELMMGLYPGMYEYEAQALVEYLFKRSGSESPGFPSILAGGPNSCIMHYTQNRRQLTRDDLLVADVGAEYHGYPADITRTIPVDGTFSEEQAIIYGIVLEAEEAAIAAARSGQRFWAPHVAARRVIGKRLKQHGIITSWGQIGQFFMHGTSHYLGLEVHDVGLYGPLKPGQLITVEPGIYIPEGSNCDPKWWNIGVRIEDDILITEGEPDVLSECVPKTIEEIEALMEETSRLVQAPGARPLMGR